MIYIGIDPGPVRSAAVSSQRPVILGCGIGNRLLLDNHDMLEWLAEAQWVFPGDPAKIVIEEILVYMTKGQQAVGRSLTDTILWSGRFWQAIAERRVRCPNTPLSVLFVPRRTVCVHLCGTPKAGDAGVRAALVDRFGPPGKKKAPGHTYGIAGDMWAALALAVIIAATLFITGPTLLGGYAVDTQRELTALQAEADQLQADMEQKKKETEAILADMDKQTKRIMRDLGVNLRIVHRDTNLGNLYTDFIAVEFPEEYIQKLAGAEEMVSDARAELGGLFFQGGPVQPGYLFFLHRLQEVIQGGSQICPGVYLGGDLEAIRAHATVLTTADPALRFYLGYSGWKEGQLEAEIGMGAWMLAEARPEFVFDAEPEQLWQRALYSLGGKYRALSYIPENPEVN